MNSSLFRKVWNCLICHCNTLEILLKHAYVGNTLGDNPISNATNNAYSRIDVSSIENGTLLYLKNAEDANIFMGTWKFFGSVATGLLLR